MTAPKTIYTSGQMTNDGYEELGFYHRHGNGYLKYKYRLVDPSEQSRIERIRGKIIETKDAWGGEGSSAYDVALSIIDEVNRSDES